MTRPKVDTLEKIKEYIFLPLAKISKVVKPFFKADQNRDKLKRIPLYLDKSLAENDATFMYFYLVPLCVNSLYILAI